MFRQMTGAELMANLGKLRNDVEKQKTQKQMVLLISDANQLVRNLVSACKDDKDAQKYKGLHGLRKHLKETWDMMEDVIKNGKPNLEFKQSELAFKKALMHTHFNETNLCPLILDKLLENIIEILNSDLMAKVSSNDAGAGKKHTLFKVLKELEIALLIGEIKSSYTQEMDVIDFKDEDSITALRDIFETELNAFNSSVHNDPKARSNSKALALLLKKYLPEEKSNLVNDLKEDKNHPSVQSTEEDKGSGKEGFFKQDSRDSSSDLQSDTSSVDDLISKEVIADCEKALKDLEDIAKNHKPLQAREGEIIKKMNDFGFNRWQYEQFPNRNNDKLDQVKGAFVKVRGALEERMQSEGQSVRALAIVGLAALRGAYSANFNESIKKSKKP